MTSSCELDRGWRPCDGVDAGRVVDEPRRATDVHAGCLREAVPRDDRFGALKGPARMVDFCAREPRVCGAVCAVTLSEPSRERRARGRSSVVMNGLPYHEAWNLISGEWAFRELQPICRAEGRPDPGRRAFRRAEGLEPWTDFGSQAVDRF
jgi:hypothetical protein